MIDIVYVTYNSEKWIRKSINSLAKSNIDVGQINVIVVDNASMDDTLHELQIIKSELENLFRSFQIVVNNKNMGFGNANNIGFSRGTSDIVCFLNIDTEVLNDTFSILMHEIKGSKKDVAIWEFRQLPYEHPKMYDPLTGETDWASGAAFAIRRKVFQDVGGFDTKLFMYVEDVDLSWRIRYKGYKIKYLPNVKIYHYSYEDGKFLKLNHQVYGLINNILLRYRYGNIPKVVMGHIMMLKRMCHKEKLPGIRIEFIKAYMKHFLLINHFYIYGKYKKCSNNNFTPRFIGTDYTQNRIGAFYKIRIPETYPLVSIIVRTCGRPCVLKETLLSLRFQTYKNIEIIVLEDGENLSEALIKGEFNDLNIVYYATKEKVGRSRAGNMAMQMARGKYLNFLDDDDLFFNDHVEVLVSELEKSKKQAAYALGLETAIKVKSKNPYIYSIIESRTVHQQKFDKVILCHHNYIPIQCAMFEKKLFDLYGGLDEEVDALEDWDLWVRFSLHTDFIYVEKTTSIYRVPYDKKTNKKRQKALDDALVVMREKHKKYETQISVSVLADLYKDKQQ